MLADLRGWSPFVALQLRYSLIDRSAERDLLPMARELDLAVARGAIDPAGIGARSICGIAEVFRALVVIGAVDEIAQRGADAGCACLAKSRLNCQIRDVVQKSRVGDTSCFNFGPQWFRAIQVLGLRPGGVGRLFGKVYWEAGNDQSGKDREIC